MTLKSIRPLLAIVFAVQACTTASRQSIPSTNNAGVSGRQIQVIEFGDHPDPNTGTPRVLERQGPWPLDIQSLSAAVEVAIGRRPTVYDIRRSPVVVGGIQKLEETTVSILGVTAVATRVSVVMDAAPTPVEMTVPTNVTAIIGSETPDQRHVFAAVSVLDSDTASRVPEIFSTREPGVKPPLKISGDSIQPTAAALEHHLKGVVVEVEIDERGNVSWAHAILGRYPSASDQSAIEKVVRSWKFAPATRNGKPVRVITNVIAEYPS